jgi:hypothetical protein
LRIKEIQVCESCQRVFGGDGFCRGGAEEARRKGREMGGLGGGLVFVALAMAGPAAAQLPFYTDDPAVTERGKFHFEFFNEFDGLHLQYPNLRQNTANYKLNYGLPKHFELDVDVPYLAIFRTVGVEDSRGGGDINLGVKWEFHEEKPGSRAPALGASFYIELPTGDEKQQLGSGLVDYWLNLIGQKSLSDKTRINGNLGYVFAGNTSTGVLGIESTRGHVFTGGLSVLHDFSAKWTLGGEAYGAYTRNSDLGRSQLQFMAGGLYKLGHGMSVSFGVLGGKYVASPRIGGQLGFSVDLPDAVKKPAGLAVH